MNTVVAASLARHTEMDIVSLCILYPGLIGTLVALVAVEGAWQVVEGNVHSGVPHS